ncbi:MAG: DEAD/DEAH box helicase, partial [Paraperlucidibaca sp.]
MTDAIAANETSAVGAPAPTDLTPDAPAPTTPILFRDLPLPNEILRAVDDLGFAQCTPIQGRVLRFTLAGHDAIGRAQTGTGKTAAFLLTVIADFLKNPPSSERCLGEPRALVLAPTR